LFKVCLQPGAFVVRAAYGELSKAARDQSKIRIMDPLGCAIGALLFWEKQISQWRTLSGRSRLPTTVGL
jgi:hypothetical protein